MIQFEMELKIWSFLDSFSYSQTRLFAWYAGSPGMELLKVSVWVRHMTRQERKGAQVNGMELTQACLPLDSPM